MILNNFLYYIGIDYSLFFPRNIYIYTFVSNTTAFLFKLSGNMTFIENSACNLIVFYSSICYNASYCYGFALAGNILMNKSRNNN